MIHMCLKNRSGCCVESKFHGGKSLDLTRPVRRPLQRSRSETMETWTGVAAV